jgi:hypothetical protein
MRLPGKMAGLIVCAWAGWTGMAYSQGIPAIPAPPAVPAIPAVPATPAVPAAPNLWTFFCPPPGTCDKCKDKICNSFVGQMAGSMLSPIRMATGGMMKPWCPTANMANPADLAKSAESPAGAAARIKQDEAEAKARRADVRYLGTVDCNRFPEAEKALIKALRTDRNECVRWEAALALNKGCCCNKHTMEALLLTATGSDKDGNPVETSPRVKHAAASALALCQGRGIDATPEPPEKAVPLPEPKKLPDITQRKDSPPPRLLPASFSLAPPVSVKASPDVIAPALLNSVSVEATGSVPTGQRGLLQIFMRRVQSAPADK